ncbi:aminomethyltransferase, mitochondrial [Zootermopsis nevadensis]|uniref:Aminomethyltransferase n=1 Tax=Zootermopsis nevadensis TaxID=136037 RepID=A0A067RHU6_ZOONE|nr:aminomethyltransferase, mitochondrial [Zootermopsis nevadensis]KDR19910.1 Aminomethyltransferase, mitochondrial [Zootermopsis nevadensis]
MVPFGGYLLPVSYGAEGIATSHIHTRKHCSVFDVSHMMQTEVRGRDRIAFLEGVTTADLINMADNTATLSIFTDPLTGGILDDLIITKTTLGYYYLVSNASRRSHDQKLLKEAQAAMRAKGKDVELRFLDPDERALLAVQGPDTAKVLQPLTDVDLSHLYFMESTLATVAGVSGCRITRCGYTGEDGVEISIPADQAVKVAELLLASEVALVKPAGLGARDSLRLEAGMCLYGNDIDHTITPVEAGLSWLVAKRRRTTADFPGATVITDQLRDGPKRKRVGLTSRGPSARAGAAVLDLTDTSDDDIVGYVTSGCPSPSLGGNIAMGYVRSELAKSGTKVLLRVRDKRVEATVCKLPFVTSKYYVRQDK